MAEPDIMTENKTIVGNMYFLNDITHNKNGVCYLYNVFILTYDYGQKIENERKRLEDLYLNHPERSNSVQPPIVSIYLDFDERYPRYESVSRRVLNRNCLCHMCDANGPDLFELSRFPNVGLAQESHDVSDRLRQIFEG